MSKLKETFPAPIIWGARLINSFDAENYPHHIDINMEFNPETNFTDKMYQRNQTYIDSKLRDHPITKMEDIRSIMNVGKVTDYAMFRNESHIHVYLRNDEDFLITIAGLRPDSSYTADYIECSPHVSARKLKKYTKRLQERFNDTSVAGKVTFDFDTERRVVRVSAQNGNDFVHFWAENRKIEEKVLGHSLA